MFKCAGDCGRDANKGYNRDPYTGQKTQLFWCDQCYELESQRPSQDMAFSAVRQALYGVKAKETC